MDLGTSNEEGGRPERAAEDGEPLLPAPKPAGRARKRVHRHELAQRERARRGPAAPAEWDRTLRRRFWRAVVAATLWFLAIPSATVGITPLLTSSDWLLENGSTARGEVVAVHTPVSGHGTPSITVAFLAGDVYEQQEINRDSGADYTVGQAVRVYYDPADPGHVRTEDEENLSDVWIGFVVVPTLVALMVFPWLAAYAVGWANRRRVARREGWEPVTAQVFDSSGGYHLLRLDFPGGAHLVARTVAAVRGRYSFLRKGPFEAWVAGEGRRLVLVPAHGPRGPAPYAVPLRVPRGAKWTGR
ncbi:DUF3592 domain-containing protein [Amycolatopsis sp. FDAARGOS 1241]|uniref:DUF3592 domain-containing protein n=1 Tax=Amycolatopsis sp. FDAARGOS 1241 TaxID=2778070 RepID=UPI00194FB7A8|nr:DUF3592 domain-containing protein [Amycolatopsis sp. FDAARGOS 1241]QRP44158.1 DUF3592 domain-containing protein [Amycolatopsis sp. FDAARGOS 1241]